MQTDLGSSVQSLKLFSSWLFFFSFKFQTTINVFLELLFASRIKENACFFPSSPELQLFLVAKKKKLKSRTQKYIFLGFLPLLLSNHTIQMQLEGVKSLFYFGLTDFSYHVYLTIILRL